MKINVIYLAFYPVFRDTHHRPAQGLVEVIPEFLAGFGDEAGKPLSLDQQPQTLDRVQIGRIRRQVDRFEDAPA